MVLLRHLNRRGRFLLIDALELAEQDFQDRVFPSRGRLIIPVGLAFGGLFFGAAGVLGSIAQRPPGLGALAAVFASALAFIAAAVFIYKRQKRSTVTFADGELRFHGVFTRQSLKLSQIQHIGSAGGDFFIRDTQGAVLRLHHTFEDMLSLMAMAIHYRPEGRETETEVNTTPIFRTH